MSYKVRNFSHFLGAFKKNFFYIYVFGKMFIWTISKNQNKLNSMTIFSFLLKNAGVILTNEIVASEKKGASFKPHCGENLDQKCAKNQIGM